MKIPMGGCANGSVGKAFAEQVQDLIWIPSTHIRRGRKKAKQL